VLLYYVLREVLDSEHGGFAALTEKRVIEREETDRERERERESMEKE